MKRGFFQWYRRPDFISEEMVLAALEFAKEHGQIRDETCHREIYLNNANRVPKEKLQTILRYQVK